MDEVHTGGGHEDDAAHGAYPAGHHTTTWDARDAARRDVANGVYVVRATTGGRSTAVKTIVERVSGR